MKKTIIISIIVLLLITGCNSESVISEPTKPSEVNTFDETIEDNHVIIHEEKYKIKGTMKETYQYKGNSELLEQKTYESHAEEISMAFVETYEYENGLIAKENFSDENGKLISQTLYTYDDQDRVLEEKAILQANDAEITKIYVYGEQTKTLFDYWSKGELQRKLITYYDEKNRIKNIESFDSEGSLTQTTNMTHANEYITKEVSKEGEKIMSKRYKEKNNMGDIIKFIGVSFLKEDESYTLFFLYDNVYDEDMRLVEKTQYEVVNQIDADVLDPIYFK